MDDEALQAWRRTRLESLANKLGGRAALGRALGYLDGAFVGQMIVGKRPITEKTIRAAEAIKGCRDWFSFLPPEKMPPLAVKYAQVLQDLEDIPPPRRHRFLDEIQEAAELAREAAAHFAARKQAEPVPDDYREEPTPEEEVLTATVTHRESGRQRPPKRRLAG